jgi:hypothetical protein
LSEFANVEVNTDKPRKGCFEVTVREGGEAVGKPIVSLLDMPRPFAKLKALDIEQVVEDVKKRLDGEVEGE